MDLRTLRTRAKQGARKVWRRLPPPATRALRRLLGARPFARTPALEPVTGRVVEPVVTVIVPVCDRSDLVQIALRSVQLQDLEAWECIVVDDASNDDSALVALRFAEIDPRFRLISHERRTGLAAARNTGIGAARGEYVCFLDDDDLLLRGSLSARFGAIDGQPDDVVGSYADWINIDPEEGLEVFDTKRKPKRRGWVSFSTAAAGVPFIATSPLLRTAIVRSVGGFDETFARAEDAELWFRLLRLGYSFVDANHVGLAYRRTPGSLVTGAPRRQFEAMLEVFDRADRPVADPSQISVGLPQLAIEYARGPQTLRYLAMIAIADGVDSAVELGRARLHPSVRAALSRTVSPSELTNYCTLRLGLDEQGELDARSVIAQMYEGLGEVPDVPDVARTAPMPVREGATEWHCVRGAASGTTPDVVLVPEALYHVDELGPLGVELQRRGLDVAFMRSPKTVDSAVRAVGRYSPMVLDHSPEIIGRAKALVVLNDWGPMRDVITQARADGVATFAKVEGVQDFQDIESDWDRRPYQWAEYVLAQGSNDVDALVDSTTFVVGSSRLERIRAEAPSERGAHALVNLNFTYRVLTEHREAWVASVAQALQIADVAGLVSRHPAERGDTAGLPVATRPFRFEVARSGLLISRFSTVPFEAMARGVPFIYHNPHGERMPTFLGHHDAFWSTSSTEELAHAVIEASNDAADYRARSQDFFGRQVDVADQPSHVRTADVIEQVLIDRRSGGG